MDDLLQLDLQNEVLLMDEQLEILVLLMDDLLMVELSKILKKQYFSKMIQNNVSVKIFLSKNPLHITWGGFLFWSVELVQHYFSVGKTF